MEANLLFIIFVIFLALAFDFTNGFHDASNSIATIVSTGVLTPFQSVLWAAFFNFIAFLVFKLKVASMIGTGLIDTSVVSTYLIFTAVLAAIIWNIITWYYGLPSSSSHALIGGLVGAALAVRGPAAIQFGGLMTVIIAIFVSPILGILLGLNLNLLVKKITANTNPARTTRWFKNLQLLSSASLSLVHGGNDAQKTMGVIAVLLYSNALLGDTFYVPLWVIISCYLVISLGTLLGGWRIVYTMGKKITQLDNMRGCCAETSAAAIIFTATHFGIPISTTHAVTGAIAGVGISDNFWATNWAVMRNIFITWILTMPVTGLIAAILMLIKF